MQRSEMPALLSTGGTLAASGGANGTVNLWDTTAANYCTPHRTAASVASMAFTRPGLAGHGADDGTVNLWDIPNAKLLRTFRGPRAEVVGVAFDPTGRTLARGSTDGTVILWDTTTARCPSLFERHRSPSAVSV